MKDSRGKQKARDQWDGEEEEEGGEEEEEEERQQEAHRGRQEVPAVGQSPLDALEGAAGHVHDAAGGTGDHAHQAFPDALEEASGALFLRP